MTALTPLETQLRDALQPFAKAAEELDEFDKDEWDAWEHSVAMAVTIGDFRRTLAALSAAKAKENAG